MRIERTCLGGFEVLSVHEWLMDGLVHGFADSSLDISDASVKKSFMKALGARTLVAPKQVHGTTILDLRDASEKDLADATAVEADGLVIESGSRGIVAAIRTADCMPVLMRAGDSIALVHAGWRGLAAGILERAFDILSRVGEVSVAFGPCIRPARFEVGEEVIAAIGPRAVFERGEQGAARISLVESAIARLPVGTRSIDCGVCTFDTRTLHSFRRDKAAAGRNLTFVLC